jgi:membrane peptidoglycan carboxypeptidase
MGLYAAPWVVHGDGPGGPETVAQATVISDNAVFARLSVDVGPANTVRVAHAMGITSPLAAVPSITLGTSSVTPLEMADAYATLADDGIHHAPQAVVEVVAASGRVLWRPATVGDRAIPAGVASTVTQVLEQVASRGTGATTAAAFPYPRAGKTGTTENSWDVWYVGYTPQLATSVWMGDMNANLPMNGAFGEFYCAPMWAQFTAAALASATHPNFAVVSWPFSPWVGAHATSSPLPSPSSSPHGSAKPTPTPTATRTTVPPTPTPTATSTAQPTPTVTPTTKP